MVLLAVKVRVTVSFVVALVVSYWLSDEILISLKVGTSTSTSNPFAPRATSSSCVTSSPVCPPLS